MKKSNALKLIVGLAAGTAAAIAGKIAADKITQEIKADFNEQLFVSPEGDKTVTLTLGSSETAKGLTYIRITAASNTKEDDCSLVVFAKKKDEFYGGEWVDNEYFNLWIGSGKRKQCCDIEFDEDEIMARYYLAKD